MVNTWPTWRIFWIYMLRGHARERQESALIAAANRERPCQLLGEIIAPLPMQKGKPKREDYEYERKGTAVALLAYDMDTGQRYVQVRKQRTKKDYAQFMHWLITEHYAQVEKVELVQDNLNTHTYGSFYEHLSAEQARGLAKNINFHFTPKHGS